MDNRETPAEYKDKYQLIFVGDFTDRLIAKIEKVYSSRKKGDNGKFVRLKIGFYAII